MSVEPAANEPSSPPEVVPNAPAASFVAHAQLIGAITLVSRVLGLAREMIVAKYFGPGPVVDAFKYAFVLPNLFRKLLGEGALSAAFIPLYGRAVRADRLNETGRANAFAAGAVGLQLLILVAVTLVGEATLYASFAYAGRPETQLGLKLAMVMLPYVIFVCAAALLGGILQVHRRFVATTATSVVLNLLTILAILGVATRYDLASQAGQRAAVWWLAVSVVVAGVAQAAMLAPSLRACGFRFAIRAGDVWTPDVRRMMRMTVPVALGLGVLQLGVVLDKQISLMASPQSDGDAVGHLFGLSYALPMARGALSRLDWAQYLYQFPLGVFGIAIATAIFPQLSGDALDADLGPFRRALARGITASMWIGLPASAGMMLIALPAVRLLFERGQFTYHDAVLTARSAAIYSSVIWAFSVQQILNRGYYALHDMRTPLLWGTINLAINLVVEIPLLRWMGESAMAVGTVASFLVQTGAMTVLLSRRVGLPPSDVAPVIGRMLLATLGMTLACAAVRWSPHWPGGKPGAAMVLFATMAVGGVVYLALCYALRVPMESLVPPRFRRRTP